jgi:hypothetical protein
MKVTAKRAIILGGTALLLLATAQEARALEPDGRMAIRLPKSVALRNVTLAATGSINIADRAVVSGPRLDVGVVANTGPGQTQLGVSTIVGTNVISTPRAFLANNARINGSLRTTTAPSLQTGATVAGGTTTNAQLTPVSVVPWTPPAAGADDFILAPDATGSISAGSYRDVIIYSRAQVTFGPGTYTVRTLDLEPQAVVTFDNRNGPIVIYVESNLITRATVSVPGGAGKMAIIFKGTNGPAIETPFNGTIVAPYSSLRLAAMGTRQFNGQYIAQSVVVDPDVRVTYAPFNWDFIQPLFPGGPIGGTPLNPPLHGVPFACFAPSFTGTTQTTNGVTRYTSLHYATPNPSAGVCAATFCDANGNQVGAPTDAEINAAPPSGSTCPAFAANTPNCPVDPASFTTTCTSDANCPTGAVCAARCVDVACANIEHRCARASASCADLPAEAACQEYRLCPEEGAVGTPNPGKLAGQLAPTLTPGADATIPEEERDTPPATYARAFTVYCHDPGPLATPVEIKDGANKPADDGNSKWGIYVEPISSFSLKPIKRSDGVGEFTMVAGGGVAAGGILFGTKVEVLSAQANAALDDCGVTLTGALKFFQQTVATWTPSAGQELHLVTDNTGGSLATPDLPKQNCQTARETTKEAIKDVRRSNLVARAAQEYYFENGLTPELCGEIQRQLGPKAVTDPNTGTPYDCNDPDSLAALPPVAQVNIINALNAEYNGKTTQYANFANNLGVARETIKASGTIDLFRDTHPYNVTILDQGFPIGPVTLTIAVDGYGSWEFRGGIQVGVGVSGNFDKASEILTNSLNGQAPRIGDARLYGGPVITPGLRVGVVAFVGVGIPGVSVGIQGEIDLLNVQVPTGLVAAAMRLSGPDTRPLTGTSWEGDSVPGIPRDNYRWVGGFNWNSELQMSELNGQVDLAVRISFLFFKKTFKKKIFGWPGFTQRYTLIGGDSGGLASSGDWGTQADDLAYTTMVPIVGPINVRTDIRTPFACIQEPR